MLYVPGNALAVVAQVMPAAPPRLLLATPLRLPHRLGGQSAGAVSARKLSSRAVTSLGRSRLGR
jgi:hypothetical protein